MVRYRGLRKSTAQLVTLFALSNPWIAGGKLFAAGADRVPDRRLCLGLDLRMWFGEAGEVLFALIG
ncbi:hypothetical protein DIE16_21635 [Burkholderia sp. Bp9090]|nr:hypothetical protein DIE16_21635 [Burkholderia sp. Bp9090]